MKIATVIFTYNRYEHTKKVLEAIKKNIEMPAKIYIFQDGCKKNEDKDAWEKTNNLIKNICWCDCDAIVSDINKGLAKSIVFGINYVFQKYDAVIVLEDDCVPHKLFFKYMHSALKYYESIEKVYSICGYGYPIEVESNGTDVYFTQRTSSWGWATWKNKWEVYEEDYKILGRIKNNPYLSQQLKYWCEDSEAYLLGNIYGQNNSWAVFWGLNVLEHDGYCVYPYKSLVENIGFDGSGVHCGKGRQDVVEMLEEDLEKEFVFCEDLFISEKTKQNFSNYWSWKSVDARNSCYYYILTQWMEKHLQGKTVNEFLDIHKINKLCIWGKGKMCDLLLQDLDEKKQILAIIESKPLEKNYRGMEIVSVKNIPKETQAIIIIPEYDYEKILWKLNDYYSNTVYKLSDILS